MQAVGKKCGLQGLGGLVGVGSGLEREELYGRLDAIALATTYLPARRASRVYPAEALRYQ